MRTYKPGDMPVPDYKVESFLGEGGYGCVYKVVNTKTGIPKALKIITLRDTQGYKEYTALALFKEIRNPYLIPIEHYWLKDENNREIKFNDDESLNIAGRGVVELLILLGLGDRSLLDRLKKCVADTGHGIPVDELMDYMNDIGKAIDFLNLPKTIGDRENVAIQHGDIKPGNVMMVGNGVQVGDYGLAQAISVTPEAGKSRTTTGGMAGTPEYAAPEQVGGKTSRSSDQYSLAISYFEMRTGKLPFDDQSNRYACLAPDGLDFSLVPPAEQEVLHKATHRQFAQRYPTCMEFVRALKRAHTHAGYGTLVNIPVLRDRDLPPQAIKPLILKPPFMDLLKEGSEDFLPGHQIGKCLGKQNEEELWQVFALKDNQNFLLKVIRGLNPSKAFDEYQALSKLHNITFDKILNIERLWVSDRSGKEIPSDQIKQSNDLFDKIVLVLIESVDKTLEDHVLEMKKNPYNDRLKRKWYDVINHICLGADYWNKHCYRAYRELNPASILVNKFDRIKIDSAGIAKYLRKERSSSASLADSFSFIAPEIFDGKYSEQSDQYSLAMIYYWLCMGDTIFPDHFKPADIKNYLQDSYLDFTKDLPDEAEILTRATLLVPEQRYPDSIEFIQAFEVALKITSIESWNKKAFQQVLQGKIEQQVAAAAPAVAEPPPPTTRSTPRGQSIKFPDDFGEVAAPTEKNILQPKSTPRDWKKTTDREPPKKPISKQVIELDNEPFKLDDDPKPGVNWTFRILLGILLVGVFSGTLYILNKYMGDKKDVADTSTRPIKSGTPTIPSSTITVPDKQGGTAVATKDTGPIKGTAPVISWDKDFLQLKETLQAAKSLPELSKVLNNSVPALLKTHEANEAATQTLNTTVSFVKLLTTQDKLTEKPLAEQTTWIKDYQTAKAALSPEMAPFFTAHNKQLESKLATHAEKLTEKVTATTPWAEQRTYYEAVLPLVADSKLLQTAIAECAMETNDKLAKPLVPAPDDALANYVAARTLAKATKPDYEKAFPFLKKYLQLTNNQGASRNQYRLDTALEMIDAAIRSARTGDNALAAFDPKKTELAKQALPLFITTNTGKPGKENALARANLELAMLTADKDPAGALKLFSTISLDKLADHKLTDKDLSQFLPRYLTTLNKQPGQDQTKAMCCKLLLDLFLKKFGGVDFEVIQNLCLKTLSEGTKLEAIEPATAKELSKSLFDWSQSILKDPADARKIMHDDLANVDAFLVSLSSLASRLNPENSLCKVYAQLFEAKVLALSSTILSYEKKDVETALDKIDINYLKSSTPTHCSIQLMKTMKALMTLKESIDSHTQQELHTQRYNACKDETQSLAQMLESGTSQASDFERLVCHMIAGYSYNVLANAGDATLVKSHLENSLKQLEHADRINAVISNQPYQLEIHNIRGLSLEDQAWVLKDNRTNPSPYSKALDEYNIVFEKSPPQSMQRVKATIDICRCIYRYSDYIKATSSNNKEYESQLRSADSIISDFLKDADIANKFPRQKIEALYFVARLRNSQLPDPSRVTKVADMVKASDKLVEILAYLKEALELSRRNDRYYQKNIVIDLVFNLQDQIAFISDPGTKFNIHRLSTKDRPDANAPALLNVVKADFEMLDRLSQDFRPSYPTISDYCQGVKLFYETAALLNDWGKSDKLDRAFDLFKSAMTDSSKELKRRASDNLYDIADIQLNIANQKADPALPQQVQDRYAIAVKAKIEVYVEIHKNNSASASRAVAWSSRVFGYYRRFVKQSFQLPLSVDCLLRALELDKNIFADPGLEPFKHLSSLYELIKKDPALKNERDRIEKQIKNQWGDSIPAHIQNILKNDNP